METLTLLTVQLKRQSLTESDDSEPNPFEQNQVKIELFLHHYYALSS